MPSIPKVSIVKTQPGIVMETKSQVVEEEESSVRPPETEEKSIETKKESEPKLLKPVKQISDIEKGVARSIFDSTFRGVVRYFESSIANQPLRVLYRLGTESARKTSEIAFLNVLDKKPVLSLNDLKNGSMRALEHVPATAIIEPSFYEGSIPRILAGLGNMTMRFASRVGLSEVNPTSRESLFEKNVLDEFASRSLFRIIPVNFDNPISGIGMRILEQLGIDLNLHVVKPFSRLADFMRN